MLKNNEIPNGVYKLIDREGKQIGMLPLPRILQLAQEQELDAILVNKDMRIVKLQEGVDEGKQKYIAQKLAKKENKNKIKVKEYKIDNMNIAKHDQDRLIKRMMEALDTGKVNAKFSLIIRGRNRSAALLPYAIQKFNEVVNTLVESGYTLQKKNVDKETFIFQASFRK